MLFPPSNARCKPTLYMLKTDQTCVG
jgi:hypothetical protein